jgi:hypothetical protein
MMSDDPDIWNQRGTLTLGHDESGGAEVPPLPDEIAEPRPLRDILVLENGQAFSADDIFELVARPDSPFR